MKTINIETLKFVIEDIRTKILNNFISSVSLINSNDIIFTFSFNRQEKLLISLQHQSPFIAMFEYNETNSTISNQLSDYLRREIKGAYITDISLINEDRVVKFSLQKKNDYFELEKLDLIIELIPTQPNLIVVKDNVVVFAKKYLSLTSSRPILKGFQYSVLENRLSNHEATPIPLNEWNNLAKNYMNESLNKRFKERYEPLYKYLKLKVKSLEKRIPSIEKEISIAKEHLVYKDHGSYILSLNEDMEQIKEYVSQAKINYDETLSAGQNANLYFKKYKKAKRTIEIGNDEIEKTKKELDKLESIIHITKFMNEDELVELEEELLPKTKSKKVRKTSTIQKISTQFGDILYGKNAIQNNELTFNIAQKDDTYMHIKDYYGSHILIRKNDVNKDTLLLGAEMALILSNKSAGDVMYTTIKNVKKGNTLGLANLLNYQIITIKEIRKSTLLLFSK